MVRRADALITVDSTDGVLLIGTVIDTVIGSPGLGHRLRQLRTIPFVCAALSSIRAEVPRTHRGC